MIYSSINDSWGEGVRERVMDNCGYPHNPVAAGFANIRWGQSNPHTFGNSTYRHCSPVVAREKNIELVHIPIHSFANVT